jgi:hypothetical protein
VPRSAFVASFVDEQLIKIKDKTAPENNIFFIKIGFLVFNCKTNIIS